jgi:hypothetical protein
MLLLPRQLLVFNLHNVDDDEADAVRALLREHRIDFYETEPHHWGISQGGLWVRDPDDHARAKALIGVWQRERQARMRARHAEQVRAGVAETLWGRLRASPLQVLFPLLVAALILVLMLAPFLHWALAG